MPPKDSALYRATRAELKRLSSKSVSYMELKEPAGAFSCGKCEHAGPRAHCMHVDVDAPVSAKHGCCNLYWPKRGKPVFAAALVRASLR